jgi:hypothetical protein
MLKGFLPLALVLLLMPAFIVGCDADNEQQRSVVTVYSMNCRAPVYSDVYGDAGSISDTWVPVLFENRPYNALVTTEPGAPHGDFLVTQYTIRWESLDGGAVLDPRTEDTSFGIPSGEIHGGYIRIVGLEDKVNPIVTPLRTSGIRLMKANITFVGHESGTERETEITTSVTVELANFIDDDVENCEITFQ